MRAGVRLCLALAVVLVALWAQGGAADAAEIAVVLSGGEAPYRQAAQAAQDALAQSGHQVRSIQLAEFTKDANSASANKYDAIVAVGTQAAVSLHTPARPQTKLIYCMVARPESLGLTPDPSCSGVSTDIPLDAQVKLIAEAMPRVRKVGMLYRSDSDKSAALMKAFQASLPGDWRLEAVAVDKLPSAAEAIDALLAKNVDIVWTAPDSSVYDAATVRSLLLAALRRNTPVFGFSPAFVQAGAMFGTGIDAKTQGEQAAALTDELLKKPQATSQPEPEAAKNPSPKFQIAVNLIVAEKLGITIPDEVIRRAAKVIRPGQEGQ